MLAVEVVAQSAAPAAFHLQHFSPGLECLSVRKAIEGAWRRLDRQECRRVLLDFSDASGKTLDANLSLGRSASEWLADLRFVDVSHQPRCQSHDRVAFTEPGHRVVFLCGSHFANPLFSLRGTPGEMIVIHEMLHTLGLRENPPTSDAITKQVARRCGDQ